MGLKTSQHPSGVALESVSVEFWYWFGDGEPAVSNGEAVSTICMKSIY